MVRRLLLKKWGLTMSKHLDLETTTSKIFDDLVNQVIDALDNNEYDSVIWLEKDIVMKCGCDSESEFLSDYVPSILENVSSKKRIDLEKVRKHMKDKMRIKGGLSYGE
jgi:hypothetical protein